MIFWHVLIWAPYLCTISICFNFGRLWRLFVRKINFHYFGMFLHLFVGGWQIQSKVNKQKYQLPTQRSVSPILTSKFDTKMFFTVYILYWNRPNSPILPIPNLQLTIPLFSEQGFTLHSCFIFILERIERMPWWKRPLSHWNVTRLTPGYYNYIKVSRVYLLKVPLMHI